MKLFVTSSFFKVIDFPSTLNDLTILIQRGSTKNAKISLKLPKNKENKLKYVHYFSNISKLDKYETDLIENCESKIKI